MVAGEAGYRKEVRALHKVLCIHFLFVQQILISSRNSDIWRPCGTPPVMSDVQLTYFNHLIIAMPNY